MTDPVRLFVLARHGQSLLNVEGRVNCDPHRDEGLSEQGVKEARALGQLISAVRIEIAVVSPFPRTMETARLALAGRDVPLMVEDDLGDVRIGTFEGRTVADYRASKPHRDRNLRFPGGESLNEAALRYANVVERLLDRDESVTLVVSHEILVRYALNAANGSDDLDRPAHDIANATPYLFDGAALGRALLRLRELAGQG